MLSIKRKNVPEYLHYSELYNSVKVPERLYAKKIFKSGKLEIDNLNDLYKVMNVIKYYQINTIPDEVYQFIIKHTDCKSKTSNVINKVLLDELINKFSDCFELQVKDTGRNVVFNSTELALFIEYKTKNIELSELFAKTIVESHVNLFKVLYCEDLMGDLDYQHKNEHFHETKHNDLYTPIGKAGNIHIIMHLVENQEKHTSDSLDNMMQLISQTIKDKKHDFTTKYLLTNIRRNKYYKTFQCSKESYYSYPYDRDLMIFATENNRLDMIEFMTKEGVKWTHLVLNYAAKHGFLDILKYAIEQDKTRSRWEGLLAVLLNLVVKNKHFSCVKYLIEELPKRLIIQINYRDIISAIENDDIEMVKYLLESQNSRGRFESFKSMFFEYAICKNAIQCLKYLHKNGYNAQAMSNGLTGLMDDGNSFEMIKYLHKNNLLNTKNAELCALAAKYGDLKVLKYLHEHKYAWDERTCNFAEQNGHLECFKYAYELDCPWSRTTKNIKGHRDIIEYMNKNFPL